MAQSVTKTTLSASVNGRRILIVGTAIGTATLVHTASSTGIDDIYLDIVNNYTGAVDVHVAFGGTTDPDDLIHYYGIPPKTSMQGAIPLHRGSLSGGLLVKVWASVASVITIGGDVNRGVIA